MDPIIDLDQLVEHYKSDPAMTHAKWVQWAVVCAEHVLSIYNRSYPDDDRPARAVAAAKAWLANPTDKRAARAAAYAAAHAARAVNAARAADAIHAAYAAARAADAVHAAAAHAAYAAADAVHAAYAAADAIHAADAAADAAAYAAETQWQAFRLMEIYDA